MKYLLMLLVSLSCWSVSAQASFETDCDALCQERRRLESLKVEYEKAMRTLDYEMTKLVKRQDASIHLQFEDEGINFQKAIAKINYDKSLSIAAAEKLAAEQIAVLSTKFKSKWEFTIPKETLERCIDKCVPPRN